MKDANSFRAVKALVVCFGIIGIFVLLLVVVVNISVDTTTDSHRACMACQHFVTPRLKSPISAKFSDCVNISQFGNTWTVNSSVDSQNSFGAMVRTGFTCKVNNEHTDGWKLVSLRFE